MIWSLLAWWQRLFFHIIRKQPSYLNPTHGITIFINKSVKSLTDQKCQQRASSYLKLVGFLISHLQHGQHSRPKTVGFNKTRNHNFFRSLASKSPIYSLDPNFAAFLLEDTTWLRKTSSSPLRGFENDGEDVLEANRRTAVQKVTHLELMLGQIANYCPVISRNIIVKNSTSVNGIWQAIRAHYGFQSTGAHFFWILITFACSLTNAQRTYTKES